MSTNEPPDFIAVFLLTLRASLAPNPTIKSFKFDPDFMEQPSEHLDLQMRTDEALADLANRLGVELRICAPKSYVDAGHPQWWRTLAHHSPRLYLTATGPTHEGTPPEAAP